MGSTGRPAAASVLGLGLGYWWADAVAATIIALDIVHDGWVNLRTAVADLVDRRPRDVEDKRWESTPDDLEQALERLPWVLDAAVRLREHGHLIIGEAFIRPLDEKDPLRRIREARALARGLDWRLQDFTVQLVGPEDMDDPRSAPEP